MPTPIAESDPRVKGEMVTFKAGSQDLSGYLVRPAADGKYPSVVVVHENRGLNPHTKDIARRLAVDGFSPWPSTSCRRSVELRPTRTRRAR